MGMFDDVNFEMKCPSCKAKIVGFQTKDAGCNLTTVDIKQIPFDGCFYGCCDNCGLLAQFTKPSFEGTVSKLLQVYTTHLTKEQIVEKIKELMKKR